MNEDRKIVEESQKRERYEDEIALIDILQVLWKWKYFILSGTVICGLIAAVISFNMSKIYSIDMVLRPGVLNVGKQGKNVYLDSPQNIKALINSGTFNNNILNYLHEIKMKNIPMKLELKASIPNDSNTIKVRYETDDVKQGTVIQNHLRKLLMENYMNKVTYYKNEFDVKLKSLKSESEYIKATIQSKKRNVKNLEKRVDELLPEIKLIKYNTANLLKERNKLFSENLNDKDILSVLVYTNTILQNLQLSNNYQNEINYYIQSKEDELQKIEGLGNEIEMKSYEIESLQFKKDNIQNIQVLQPPTRSSYSVRPKKKLDVILALIAGLFIMLFLVFFLEYLSKLKKSK